MDMLTNADITIYNHKYNKSTRFDEWHRTIIRGVRFYVDNKVSAGEKGINSADAYKIRIPEEAECDKSYIAENEYVSAEDVTVKWTIQESDIVVLGICEMDIMKPSDLTEKSIRYCKIVSWSDNRFGGLPHWRIGGV